MDERFEGELVRETPNAVTSGIRYAWLALTFALLPAYGFPLLPESVLALGGAAWFPLSFVMIGVMRRFAKRPKRARVRVAIDSVGLHVDGNIVARRTELVSGAATTDAHGVTRVVLQRRRTLASFFGVAPLIVFLASDAEQRRALLAAGAFDAERHVFKTTFLRPQSRWHVIIAIAVYLVLSAVFFGLFWRVSGFAHGPVLATVPVIAAGAFAMGLFRVFARTTVSVGTDGIEIRRPLRTRFIPLDDIRDVRADAKALHVSLVNGETLSLAAAAPIEPVGTFGASDIGMERGLLGDRIVEALRAHTARRADAAAAIAMLRRDARTSREWLDGLRALAAGASDYRTNVVRVEDLQRVIADPAADGDVRVGAAVALRIAEGSAATERIRVAATATAAPDLRGALEAIADSTDDGLEAHLATLS